MRFFFILIFIFFFNNCSFDNKTGIWKNENLNNKEKKNSSNRFKEFKTLSTTIEPFDQTINLNTDFNLNLLSPEKNFIWLDTFYNTKNNLTNFKYDNLNNLIFKSKKISRFKLSENLLFDKNKLITNDDKGNIIIYSISENRVVSKFNFYKKKFKNIKKKLNFIIENNIVYVSDNLGFLYALNYQQNKLIWAKNLKIPFNSNLKLSKNILFASNQNNDLYFFDKKNGNLLKSIPTEQTIVKNNFINNLSLNDNSLFFLNTYGSLYSVDIDSMKLKWFLNINQSLDINPSNLFSGNQITVSNNKLVVSSNEFTYIIETDSGAVLHKKNFSSKLQPTILNNYLFIVSNNNFLIIQNLNDGNIIYSQNINQLADQFLETKNKKINFKKLMIINGKIFIFLTNSHFIKINLNGSVIDVTKLPSRLESKPIIIDNSLLYLNDSKKLVVIN